MDEREFEFPWVFTRALSIPRPIGRHGFRRVVHIPLNVVSVLNRFRPDVVVSDQLEPRTASAVAFCRLHKRPLIIWWEGTPHTEDGTSVSHGSPSEEAAAARNSSVGRRRRVREISDGIRRATVADRPRYDWNGHASLAKRGEARTRYDTFLVFREQYGLRGTVILFVGRLTELKGIPELLAALSLLAMDCDLPAWSALFVGSGPLARNVEAWAQLHPAVPVAVAGFVQPPDLARYYAAADLFAMPTLIDRWALVCLDALVAGIPQVTSSLAGAAELVTSSEIGSVVDPRDARSLPHQLAHRIRMGPKRVPEALRDHATIEWSPVANGERCDVVDSPGADRRPIAQRLNNLATVRHGIEGTTAKRPRASYQYVLDAFVKVRNILGESLFRPPRSYLRV